MGENEAMVRALLATAIQADISFADVYQAVAEVHPQADFQALTGHTVLLIETLLDRGLIPVTSPFDETNEPDPPLLNRTLDSRTCLSHSSLGSKPYLAFSICLGNWL